MIEKFVSGDGSTFRLKSQMKTRNDKLRSLKELEEEKACMLDALAARFKKEILDWCSLYIIYTAKNRDNLYRLDLPGTDVPVWWNPSKKTITRMDYEGVFEISPWQMKTIITNQEMIKRALAAEQDKRMKSDNRVIDYFIKNCKRQMEDMKC